MEKETERKKTGLRNVYHGIRIPLVVYDLLIFLLMDLLLFVYYSGGGRLNAKGVLMQSTLVLVLMFSGRLIGKVYLQVLRYGGIQCYVRLLVSDSCAYVCYVVLESLLPIQHISFAKLSAFCSMTTLGALSMRILYRYAYKYAGLDNKKGALLRLLLKLFAYGRVHTEAVSGRGKIPIAIIGAGTISVELAEDLWNNPRAAYDPRCFVDIDTHKVGREIHGIPVWNENDVTLENLKERKIQEVVLALPSMDRVQKLQRFDYYRNAGFQVKVFDYPAMESPGSKRKLLDFRIEDLLARHPREIMNEKTRAYYQGKVILITGGGGSIGSELCRQLAQMGPKQIIIVDIYENCAYDLQQDLFFTYRGKIDVQVEIVSITNQNGMRRVFEEYRPDICIHAAAHKHVPLMEKNCIEAVQNNVFGTLNVVQMCEAYGCGRFMLVSTDKAVNPTNVMGATKRMCEMIMQAYSTRGKVLCSATRFGNVLGSAGSVIPIFERQIGAGGPVTVTDKRIIRYFMTIPEASQLVLTSGAMAKNGELFVLDMGEPVKIYDLAKNMIHISGNEDIQIVEVGLRPGEKLFEELLIKTEELEKTENDLIYIEREEAVTMEELIKKLEILTEACEEKSDEIVRDAMRCVVPTFRKPEEINEVVKAG